MYMFYNIKITKRFFAIDAGIHDRVWQINEWQTDGKAE